MHLTRNFSLATTFITGGVMLALLTIPVRGLAASKKSSGTRRSEGSVRITKHKQTATQRSTVRHSRVNRSVASRRVRSRQRLARLRLESSRVKEIQQALTQAGYLNQEPTGNWDDATRNAMRRYQADNSFPPTGLPEAKSLLKLGLGPHPLPPELDTAASQGQSPETDVTRPRASFREAGQVSHQAFAAATSLGAQ